MSQFEFFMTFFSLLLGLSVGELFLGFAQLIRARTRPRLGWLTPLAAAVLLMFLIVTFLDSWTKFQAVPLNLWSMTAFCLVGVCYFVATGVAVPRDPAEWSSLDDYFLAHRFWIIGPPIAAGLILLVFEIPAIVGRARDASELAIYAIQNIVIFGLLFAILWSRRPRLSAVLMIALIASFYVVLPLMPDVRS